MKRRLFWKILLGFWITFVAVTQLVWIGAALYRGAPSARERAQWPGAIQMASATVALRSGGATAVDRLKASWPASARSALTLTPLQAPARAAALVDGGAHQSGAIAVISRGPDGVLYRLMYRPPARPLHRSFLAGLVIPLGVLAVWGTGGLLFSALLAWYLTHPISRLRTGFDRLAHGDLAVRLKPEMGRRRDEIADLAGDFDTMAERLQQLVRARDQLMHDVSHELRSPLARLNMAIGLARQTPQRMEETLTRIEHETGRLDVLVGELLTLARVESGDPQLDGYFEIEGLVRTVVDDARFEADASGVQVRTNVEDASGERPRPTVKGNPELLRRAIENIVRNALRFSKRGQTVDVDVDADQAARSYILRIRDEGPGVPPESLQVMFDPFIRVHEVGFGKGYGLGLAIARRTILAHSGSILAENRPEGGLAVTVRLPFGPRS